MRNVADFFQEVWTVKPLDAQHHGLAMQAAFQAIREAHGPVSPEALCAAMAAEHSLTLWVTTIRGFCAPDSAIKHYIIRLASNAADRPEERFAYITRLAEWGIGSTVDLEHLMAEVNLFLKSTQAG